MDTRQQKIAQSLDRHLAVTANAGSGKTRVLVNRYINILLNGPLFQDKNISPKNIVAITFTRKAAAEMLAKVVSKIEEMIIKEQNLANLDRLKEIREQLTNARISTIHSFCNDLLREYPIEAQISPIFTEISEAQKLLILKEGISAVLEEWLINSELEKIREKARILILELGRKNLEQLLEKLSSNPFLVEKLLYFYKKDNETILKQRDLLFYKIFFDKILHYTYVLEKIISDSRWSSPIDKDLKKFENIISCLEKLQKLLDNKDKTIYNFYQIIKTYCEACELIFNQQGEVRAPIKKNIRNYSEVSNSLDNASDLFLDLKDALESFEFLEYDEKTIDNARIVAFLAQDVIDYCEEEKEFIGGLDFEDTLLKTHNLLKNDTIKNKIREKIKFLLVDEFQDTNDLQYEIIKKIVPELETKIFNKDSTNLFIVGDVKQSIYGFRNANVRIFQKIKEEIIEINKNGRSNHYINEDFQFEGEIINAKNEQEILGNHILSVSFRLKPAISAFVNKVCSNIMKEDELGFEFGYEPLVCTRNFDILEEFYNNKKEIDENLLPKLGTITFITQVESYKDKILNFYFEFLQEEDSELEDSEKVDEEAELLAKYIKNIVESNSTQFYIEENGKFRKPIYRDIAVLARRKKRFYVLSEAFLKYNIPFVIHSGSNIFDSFEINDILEFLKFILNNKDDSALISILRSPLFRIKDSQIYAIFCENNHLSLWEKFEIYLYNNFDLLIDSQENNLLHRAYTKIKNILEVASTLSFSELITKILDSTGWYGTICKSPRRLQLEEEINKLIDIARELFSRGYKGLNDLVNELLFLKDYEITDREQISIPNENVVNIMTIHASKGLEFPIVSIFDTNFRTRRNANQFYFTDELGISFNNLAIDKDGNSFFCSTPIKFLSSYIKNLEEIAEEKRLLYVALTRAKDHLIITTTLKENKDGSIGKTFGIINLILEGLHLSSFSLLSDEKKVYSETLAFKMNDKEFDFAFPLTINLRTNVDLEHIDNIIKTDELHTPHFTFNTLESDVSGAYYSATRFLMYSNDRQLYNLKYILGLPTKFEYFESKLRPKEDDRASLIGTIIHQTLQKINDWLDLDCSIKTEILIQVIDTTIEFNKTTISKEAKERILRELINLVQTDLIQKNTSNILKALPEYSLIIPFGSDFLLGVIDLLIQNNKNLWEVWDWKTNRIENEKEIYDLANYYKPQMQFYAYLLSRLYPTQNEYNAVLLFTNCSDRFKKNDKWCYNFRWKKEDFAIYEKELNKLISEMPY